MLDSIQAWEGAVVIQDTFTTETDIPGLCLREGQQAREVIPLEGSGQQTGTGLHWNGTLKIFFTLIWKFPHKYTLKNWDYRSDTLLVFIYVITYMKTQFLLAGKKSLNFLITFSNFQFLK